MKRSHIAIGCALAAATSTFGQLVAVDNFNDGNDNGWGHLDLLPPPYGPTNYNVVSGEYVLSSSQPIGPIPQQVPTAAFWQSSVGDPFFANGTLTMDVRANNGQTSVFSMLRANPLVGDAYSFSANPVLNTVYISRVIGLGITDIASAPFTFTPGQDYTLEASAINSTLSLKIWISGGSVPASPQVTVSDSALTSGAIGLGIFKWTSGPDGELSGAFDDVSFNSVPSPATGLALLGGLAVMRRRTRAH